MADDNDKAAQDRDRRQYRLYIAGQIIPAVIRNPRLYLTEDENMTPEAAARAALDQADLLIRMADGD